MAGVDDDWNQSDAFGEDDRWDLRFDEELDEAIDELLRSEFDRAYPSTSSSGESYHALDELRPTLVRVRRRQQVRRAAGATMAGAALSVLGVLAVGQIEPPGGARVEVLSPAADEQVAGPAVDGLGASSSVRPGLPAASGTANSDSAVASEPPSTEAQTGASSADAPRSADGTDESTTASTLTPSSATSVVSETSSSVATTAAPTTSPTTVPQTAAPTTTSTSTASGPTTSSTVYTSIPHELEINTSCGGDVKLKANRYRVYVDEIEHFSGRSDVVTLTAKHLEVTLESGGRSCKIVAEVKSGDLRISVEDGS